MLNTIALPSFVLGYHGCDQDVAEMVLSGKDDLLPSANDYDWLGHGTYFWEHNPRRAFEWAEDLKRRNAIRNSPAVVGAIIHLGDCLNLLDSSNLQFVGKGYDDLKRIADGKGDKLQGNQDPKGMDSGGDMLLRFLDCQVINYVAQLAMDVGHPLDSVRGVFVEGRPLYPNAGFREKSHIQVCIRNPDCIVGYFRVREDFR